MSLGWNPQPPFYRPWKIALWKKCKNTRFWTRFSRNRAFPPNPTQSVSCRRPQFLGFFFLGFFVVIGCDGECWGILESEWGWRRSKWGPRRPQAPPRPPMTPPNRGQDRFWTPKRASKSMKNRLKHEPWKKGLFRSPLPRKCKMFWLWNWKGRC